MNEVSSFLTGKANYSKGFVDCIFSFSLFGCKYGKARSIDLVTRHANIIRIIRLVFDVLSLVDC